VLLTHDAGSDSGTTYLSSDEDTVPPEPIVKSTTPLLAEASGYQPPVGRFALSIVSVDGFPPYEDFDGDGPTDLRENEHGTDPRLADTDDDGHTDTSDNCPVVHNPVRGDNDADSHGDACDGCPLDRNPGQSDSDGEGDL